MLNDLMLWYRRHGWRGFSRFWYYWRPPEGLLLCRANDGTKFFVNPNEYIDNHVIRSGGYETEVAMKAAELLPPNGVVWDVGANIGTFCLPLHRLRPDATIYAFEPNVQVLTRLIRNIEMNNARVVAQGFALGQETGATNLFLTSGNAGMSSLINWDTKTHNLSSVVAVIRPDILIDIGLIRSPNVMKLDVEGTELSVLNGFGRALEKRDLSAILFEAARRDVEARLGIAAKISSAGFLISELRRNEDTSHNLENFVGIRHLASG